MAKTKRTVEEVNSATTSEEAKVTSAASNDSKLVTQGKLRLFANKFWTKIKDRYDGTFKSASLTDAKKLIFTKTNDSTQELDLSEYARLKDRNPFKQDVSVDDAETKNNLSIGRKEGMVDPSQRSLGARNLSSGLFTDGYVSKFRVYIDNAYTQQQVAIHVWAIKKGATKSNDRTAEAKLIEGRRITVASDNTNNKKWIDVDINKAFANDTYFIFRTGEPVNVEAITNIKSENSDHVANLIVDTPPSGANQQLIWRDEITDRTAYVEIFGRMGIADLTKKIDEISADSSLYVKQDEVSTTSVANKVVRLDGQGKLDKDMLPTIAINEYFEIAAFDHATLQNQRYENGDVVVVNSTGKRYLCINKNKNPNNLTEGFIELNSKDGSVVSVNGKTGAVNLTLEAASDKLKLKIAGDGGTAEVETAVDIITDEEIDAIIGGLTD